MASHPNGKFRMAPRALAAALLALSLAGCAGQAAYREGQQLVAQDQVEAGLAKYREAVAADPGNAAYRVALLGARDRAAMRLIDSAERRLAAGQTALAAQDYQRVLAFDPNNERARAGLRQVEADARHVKLLKAANEAFEQKDYETARQHASAILTERPNHEPARLLVEKINDALAVRPAQAGLDKAYRTPISIEFRDVALKQVFEVIAMRSGLNFIFDKDVKTDARTSIFLKNSNVEAAIYFLLMSNQLEQQVMDGNTVMIYPNTAVKLREYQEQTVKTFYLANADAKNIGNTLKTIVKSRDVVIDEKLNLVIVRDSPEAIKLATKLVALQDVAEPEVMLDVEILEIKRSSITELGVSWPKTLGFAPLQTSTGGALSIDTLRALASSKIGITGVSGSVTANRTDGDSNTLANPSIRVRNKEKAKVVIGDKVPNVSATVSTSGVGNFATENITYVDVGLTLNVEPTIYLNNEVAIRIALEVSNVVDTLRTNSGSVAYRIGTRSANTMLQLKDGENQVLAGLINNEDRSSGSKVPGIGNLPIVGRLFGRQNDTTDKTEIVLSITPHLVRTVQRPPASASEFGAGTEANFRRRPETQGAVVTAPAPVRAVPAPTPAPAAPQAAPANAPAPAANLPSANLPATPSLSSPAPAPAPAGVVVTPIPAPPAAAASRTPD